MPTSRRLILSPLLLAVALAGVLGVATSSAAAGPAPETCVRAISTATADAVGQQSGKTAGGVGCLRSAQPDVVSGSCVATNTANGAANAATGPALARQLAGEEASSIFTTSGGLKPSVIDASTEIIPGTGLSNGQLIKNLTADGSSLADWGKYTTPTYNSPSGPFQVHFYMNPSTGVVHYLDDYKVVFNGPR
ncbi:MAG: hypothetical protein Q7V57_17225 [Actinomycetota bacterium]|nr:hypothetical protein [Actinomycetota bacterium]